MKIFKMILGLVVMALGLGMATAGWAIATYGQWTLLVKIFLGFTLGFFGIGLGWAGLMLIRGWAVRDVLGGVVTAQPGLSVSSHYSGKDDQEGAESYSGRLARVKDIIKNIFLYIIIAIVVILIAIFSVFRVIGGFPV